MPGRRLIYDQYLKDRILAGIAGGKGEQIYIRLYVSTDDAGVILCTPDFVKGQLATFVDCDVDAVRLILNELAAEGYVDLYAAGRDYYAKVLAFDDEQRLRRDIKKIYLYPPPDEGEAVELIPEGCNRGPAEHTGRARNGGVTRAARVRDGRVPSKEPKAKQTKPKKQYTRPDSFDSSADWAFVLELDRFTDPVQLFATWNILCPNLPQVSEIDDARWSAACREVDAGRPMGYYLRLFKTAARCKHTRGVNGWQASFDWFMTDRRWRHNRTKVLEGNFGPPVGAADQSEKFDPQAETKKTLQSLERWLRDAPSLNEFNGSFVPAIETAGQGVERILAGDLRDMNKVEDRLNKLDDALGRAMIKATGTDIMNDNRTAVERDLAEYRDRMAGGVFDATVTRSLERRMRKFYGIPQLSLFAI